MLFDNLSKISHFCLYSHIHYYSYITHTHILLLWRVEQSIIYAFLFLRFPTWHIKTNVSAIRSFSVSFGTFWSAGLHHDSSELIEKGLAFILVSPHFYGQLIGSRAPSRFLDSKDVDWLLHWLGWYPNYYFFFFLALCWWTFLLFLSNIDLKSTRSQSTPLQN